MSESLDFETSETMRKFSQLPKESQQMIVEQVKAEVAKKEEEDKSIAQEKSNAEAAKQQEVAVEDPALQQEITPQDTQTNE